MSLFRLLPALLLFSACSSPPKPPQVDEAKKRPANAQAAVDLQVCKSELHNTRIVVAEKSRDADSTRAAFAKLAALRQTPTVGETSGEDWRSTIHTILFDFGSTRVDLPPAEADRLVHEARSAPLILLSGRTDGGNDNLVDSRIARRRSEAVRSFLLAAGVAPEHIRTTWQPVGDHAAENTSSQGRALNRRVEIEIYRLAPRIATPPETGDS